MTERVDLQRAVWVITDYDPTFAPNRLLVTTLRQQGIRVIECQRQEVDTVRTLLRMSDAHVIFYYPPYHAFDTLQDAFRARGNYSVVYSDWWTVPHNPCAAHADALIFNHYNVIRAIRSRTTVPICGRIPLLTPPERRNVRDILLSVARIPYLPCAPAFAALRALQRWWYRYDEKRLYYFPFAVDVTIPEFANPWSGDPEYDFANVGATSFFCRVRSCYMPARTAFINLYDDRRRLANAVRRCSAFRVFDCRKIRVVGRETLRVVQRSRYVIVTGGYHGASVLKYLEIIAAGTPVIGTLPSSEFPVIRAAVYDIGMYLDRPRELSAHLRDALVRYGEWKRAALLARKRVLALYNQDAALRLLQQQYHGAGIPRDYVH